MTNLTRYDPFHEIEDLFRGFLLKPIGFNRTQHGFNGTQQMQIKTDISEDDKAYTVHAEIPGVKKEDIKVSVDGNQISISAEVKKEKEEKHGKEICSERYFGSAYRSFTLDHEVDESKADAKYEGGVLNLTLPKKAGGKSKQLEVHIN